jgi:hypothetical protein
MSSISRYRGGNVSYIALPTANDGAVAHAIEVGDLVYVSGGVAYPASHLADGGDAATNRAALAALFAGVAVQKIGLQTGEKTFHLTDDPGWVLVATSGDFAFDCATGISWLPNSLVGVYNDATNNSDQKVCLVTAYGEAIGVVKLPYNALAKTTLTEVIVSIRPMYVHEQLVYGSGQ